MSSSFADLGVPKEIADVLEKAGIAQPFPIQTATIAEALTGRDVCAKAPTGSGKTLAFGIPLVTRIERARPRCPRALVLVPTRELCMQVAEALKPIAKAQGLRVAQVFGGAGYGDQARQIRQGCDIVVACPGRLGDLIQRGDLMLKDVEVVVLDEADRMSDMGFLPEVKKLLGYIVVPHQMLLFSATLEGSVNKFVREYLKNPFRFETSSENTEKSKAIHLFWESSSSARLSVCARIAKTSGSTIIFCRTKRGVDRLNAQLKAEGVKSVVIHGDRSQAQRTRALAMFTDGKVSTLVATDVAARGIHVDNVDCVIHFDQPADHTDYTHRSGRTARAGADGTVISLLTRDQVRAAKTMQRKLDMNVSISAPQWDDISHLGTMVITPKPKAKSDYSDDRSEGRGGEGRSANRGNRSRGGSKGYGGDRSRNTRTRSRYSRDENGSSERKTGEGNRSSNERSSRDGAPRDGSPRSSSAGRKKTYGRNPNSNQSGGAKRGASTGGSSRSYGRNANGNQSGGEKRTSSTGGAGRSYGRKPAANSSSGSSRGKNSYAKRGSSTRRAD